MIGEPRRGGRGATAIARQSQTSRSSYGILCRFTNAMNSSWNVPVQMVFRLLVDVSLDPAEVRKAHGERTVAGLPGEAAEVHERFVDPSRRVALDVPHRVGRRPPPFPARRADERGRACRRPDQSAAFVPQRAGDVSHSRGDHSGRISGSRFLVLKTKWQYMQANDCDMGLPFEVLPPLRVSWVIDALYSWG